jgi:hypothetical protein
MSPPSDTPASRQRQAYLVNIMSFNSLEFVAKWHMACIRGR